MCEDVFLWFGIKEVSMVEDVIWSDGEEGWNCVFLWCECGGGDNGGGEVGR